MLGSALLHGLIALTLPAALDSLAIQTGRGAWQRAVGFERALRIQLPGPVYAPVVAPPEPRLQRVSRAAASDLRNPARLGEKLVRAQAILSMSDLDTSLRIALAPAPAAAAPVPPPPPNPLAALRVHRMFVPPAAPAGMATAPAMGRPGTADLLPGDPPPVLSLSGPSAWAGGLIEWPGGSTTPEAPPPEPAATAAEEDGGAPSALLARLLRQVMTTTRVAHPPNGTFDVVVESSGGNLLPEGSMSLSGRPVHAVFLKVGARKDWILQYCIPARDEPPPQAMGGVVRLGAPSAVQAPYPRTTYRPPARRRAYILVHGLLEASGRFGALRMLDTTDADEVWLVLTILQRWEFRPATVGGRPVRLEILLAIPPEA